MQRRIFRRSTYISRHELFRRLALERKAADLDIPGEKEFAGQGVVYCATCDGPLLISKRLAIIGGGNSALEAAIEMSGLAAHVSLISRGDWSGETILHDKVSASDAEVMRGFKPTEIHGEQPVTGLDVRQRDSGGTRRLAVDGVFIVL